MGSVAFPPASSPMIRILEKVQATLLALLFHFPTLPAGPDLKWVWPSPPPAPGRHVEEQGALFTSSCLELDRQKASSLTLPGPWLSGLGSCSPG